MGCWFILNDPCGLCCYLFGWATILYVNYTLTTEVLWPWLGTHWSGLIHLIGFQTLIGLICSSYYRAATTDPGSVETQTATKNDVYAPEDDPQRLYKPRRRFCEKCECIKPPRAHHCSTCKRCINKMDHHCPWVNNCVGSNNLKFFLLFLFYTFWGGVYSALMFIVRFLLCWKAAPGSPNACPEPGVYTIVSCVVSCVLAIFFAIFTAAMAWDQWEGMVTNTTGIESMKGWAEEDTPLMHALIEVFGERFSWRWFAPVPLHQTGCLTGYYAWSPFDDPDAYDVRDPAIGKHFRRIESYLAEQAAHQTPEEADQARRTAVQAAAEIHRRHALKKRAFFTQFSKAQLKQLEQMPKVSPSLPLPLAPAGVKQPGKDAATGTSTGVNTTTTTAPTASSSSSGSSGAGEKGKDKGKNKAASAAAPAKVVDAPAK